MEAEWLEGKCLISMPTIEDGPFHRSVVFMCAHSEDGAMGITLNRAQQIGFTDMISQLELVDDEAIRLPEPARRIVVRDGGPVDRSRGFVLHSRDYTTSSSMNIAGAFGLTATVDVLRAICDGSGPERAMVALGYAGWGPGQLESEIAENGWLVCSADEELLFETELDNLYDRALAQLGITADKLTMQAGNA